MLPLRWFETDTLNSEFVVVVIELKMTSYQNERVCIFAANERAEKKQRAKAERKARRDELAAAA